MDIYLEFKEPIDEILKDLDDEAGIYFLELKNKLIPQSEEELSAYLE